MILAVYYKTAVVSNQFQNLTNRFALKNSIFILSSKRKSYQIFSIIYGAMFIKTYVRLLHFVKKFKDPNTLINSCLYNF